MSELTALPLALERNTIGPDRNAGICLPQHDIIFYFLPEFSITWFCWRGSGSRGSSFTPSMRKKQRRVLREAEAEAEAEAEWSECKGGPAFGNMDALDEAVPVNWFQYLFQPIKYARCNQNHQLSGIPMAVGALLMIRKGSNNNGLSVEDSLRQQLKKHEWGPCKYLWATTPMQVWHLPSADILMDGSFPSVTLEESKIFQRIDRQLYTILVRDLWRNPLDCLQIMGLWLWLERLGFSNAISKILSQPLFLINELADEAIACLKCMDGAQFPLQFEATEIPLTQSIVQKDLSLKYFHLNRLTAYNEIQTLIIQVYIPVLSDIMEKACHGGFGESLNNSQMSTQGHAASGLNPMMAQSSDDDPLMQSFSNINIQVDTTPPSQSNVVQANEPTLYERTMFATFSKGYPVSESEIRQFFSRVYGNCIESVHMQEVKVNEQALYARVVFLRPAFIDSILSGMSKAKFSINGKHVWMRKFVPNNGRPS